MPTPQTCAPTAIASFPLTLGFSPMTDARYDSVSEPLTMDFQWSARSTPPLFVTPKASAITDEVGAGNTNLSTARFMNNTYKVASVQIIRSSHKSWIMPVTSQAQNIEDIVIVFASTDTTISYPYITFVIPIIRSNSPMNPSYLLGLSDPNSNGPFSLQSCFPTSPQTRFAYYATCLAGYSGNAATQNMYVFLATNGLQVSSTLMTKILGLTGTGSFGTYSPPFMSRLSSLTKTISDSDFTNYVMTTNQLLNYASFSQMYPSIDTGLRQDDASAYQCVPIDPDSAIQDGKLQVDIASGEVLTDVMAKRAALRASHNVTSSTGPSRLNTYFGSALGIILIIMFSGSVLYGIFLVVMMQLGDEVVDAEGNVEIIENPIFTIVKQFTSYIVAALIAGFLGIIIGLMLN